MQFRSFYLAGLLVLAVISCKKDKDDNETETPTTYEVSKLKTIRTKTLNTSQQIVASSTTSISVDSVSNKTTLITYDSINNITTTDTYTYNSKHQLLLFERASNRTDLYISRMEFSRNSDGQLTKVNSSYINGKVATSEGTVQYQKKQDTTFVTFIDSTYKSNNPYDIGGTDYYKLAFVNNRVVVRNGTVFEYDATGSIVAVSVTDLNIVYYYKHSNKVATEIQKYLAYMGGDIPWFFRELQYTGWDATRNGHTAGNVLESFSEGNYPPTLTFINEFDGNGNLIMVTQYANTYSTPSVVTEYEYWP